MTPGWRGGFLVIAGSVTLVGASCGYSDSGRPAPSADLAAAGQGPSRTGVTESYRYSSGESWGPNIEIDVPAAGQTPRLDRSDAWNAYLKTHLYPQTARAYPADLRFGLATNRALGQIGPDGAVSPKYIRVPTWVVSYHNVVSEMGFSGAPTPPGVNATSRPKGHVEHVDILVVLSADTGDFMFSFEASR